MNIAVTGSSGFLGKKFIDLYGNYFETIIKLNSKNAPLDNKEKVISLTKQINVIVHFAFDHEYKYNIIGIRNILEACKKNNVTKLVFISSVSVYNPFIKGELNEESNYSKLYEPYSREKQKIEEVIEKEKNKSLEVLILQPSIVYGVGGNWTKFAFNALKTNSLFLPKYGEGHCNAVYVNDVAQAVYKSCTNKNIEGRFLKLLISGKKVITWFDFYQLHNKLLVKLNLPSKFNVRRINKSNKYSDNSLKNLIFYFWYETYIGIFLNYFVSFLKKIRSRKYIDTSSVKNFITFMQSDIKDVKTRLLGITYTNHKTEYKINVNLAEKELDYNPKYNIDLSIEEMYIELKKII